MRVVSLFISAYVFLLQSPVQAPTPAQRDPQAIASLSQMLSATGWGNAQVQDVVSTGTVTRYHGDSQDAVGVKFESLGPRFFRSDVQDPAGTFTTILKGDGGVFITPSSTYVLPYYAAIAMRPIAFPFFAGCLSYTDATYNVSYGGLDTIAGQSAYRVELEAQPGGTDPISLLRARASKLTLWISAATSLPVQIEYMRISNDDPRVSRQVTQTFSDYRTVGAFVVPFHQEEYANGNIMNALQLSAVNLNTGVSAADFALPTVQN